MSEKEQPFTYDVFLSHSVKDKAVVRPLAERLRKDGLRPKAEGRKLNAEVELQPSAFPWRNAFPSIGARRTERMLNPVKARKATIPASFSTTFPPATMLLSFRL